MNALFFPLLTLAICSLTALAKDKGKDDKMALKDNLEAYYNMEQNPEVVPVHDQSHNGHHLTGYLAPRNVAGVVDKGIELLTFADGSSQYLDLLLTHYPGINLNGTDFTVAGWFNPARLVHNMGILGSQNWWARVVVSGDSYYVNVRISTSNITITDVPLEVGKRYFLVFGWHGIAASAEFGQYSWATVNLSDRIREARTPWANTNQTFAIGSHSSTDTFSGMVDEIGIWSRRLTALEIRQIYNKGKGLAFTEWDKVSDCRMIPCCK